MQFVHAKTPAEAPRPAQQRRGLFDMFSAAPWWVVSAMLHVLLIALAGLISMAIELPKVDESLVMVTELVKREPLNVEPEKPDIKTSVLASDHDTPPTDPLAKNASEIVVPPDILAKAEIGDHFETINPDRPDTHSAFGNPDAQMFHSVQGNDEPPGGGGVGGTGLEGLIGVGGAGSPGTGGGWGGGNGTGTGIGNGSGHGSFGNRNGGGRRLMVRQHGGNKKTEDAVDRGLEWLARHQEPDGHWDPIKNGAAPGKCTALMICPEGVDFACTGWALLAFLGAGHTEKTGQYKENVIRAVEWLKKKQDYDSGLYCKLNYGHAIAGMAMAEAAAMARMPETIESAQKAVDATCGLKLNYPTSERAGWGYMTHQLGDVKNGDMSNSGWAMMFVKSAKVANLKIPNESIEGIYRYLDACQIKEAKNDGYPAHKYSYNSEFAQQNKWIDRGYIAILGRLFFGTPPDEVADGTRFAIEQRKLPGAGEYDLYYFYYMSLITFQVGGDLWKDWNEALRTTIPPKQIVAAGDNQGSWDPEGKCAGMWGRVGQTALSVLCMEVYYRYQKLKQ